MNDGVGPYKVMHRPELVEGRYTARAVEPDDIESIRKWRNAQIDVLRQSRPITPEEQVAYYARTIWPGKSSTTTDNILLTMFEDGVRKIGRQSCRERVCQ